MAVSRAVSLARAFAAAAALAPPFADRLALVVEEWIANVIEHGGPHAGRIALRLRLSDGAARISISDAGRPFDPRTAAFDGPNQARGGGAGLALIRDHCRISAYTRRGGRNRLTLELWLD